MKKSILYIMICFPIFYTGCSEYDINAPVYKKDLFIELDYQWNNDYSGDLTFRVSSAIKYPDYPPEHDELPQSFGLLLRRNNSPDCDTAFINYGEFMWETTFNDGLVKRQFYKTILYTINDSTLYTKAFLITNDNDTLYSNILKFEELYADF